MRSILLLAFSLGAGAQECDRIFETPAHYLSGTTRDVVAANYDFDARPDLLVARDAQGDEPPGLTLLRNRPVGFAVASFRVPLPGNALRLFSEDVNSDGRMDAIAVGASFLATVTSQGNGTFQTVITNVTGDALQQVPVTFGDFSGDGRGDVAAGASRSLRVFRRQLDGSFTEPVVPRPLTRQLAGLAAGDVDGDGRVDLAYADGTTGGWY